MSTVIGYPLAIATWNDSEYQAIQRVIDSGMFSMGKYVEQFEIKFANYIGSKYCVAVNSGSSANLLMVAALRYRQKDSLNLGEEVIVPAVSWSTTYFPLQQYGLKLKFVDIDRNTLNYDLDALDNAVTNKTRAIMVVNLLGNPNNFDIINKIANKYNLIVMEDNCESLGATFYGKQAGSFGIMGTFSGFFSHHISTMEGGMIVTNDEEIYHILLSLRAHGWTRNLPKQNRLTGTKSDDPFEESFKFVLPGYNVRPLEISGAIGIEQLEKLPAMIKERRYNAQKFLDIINKFPYLRAQQEISNSSWFGFSIVVEQDSPVNRCELVSLFARNKIDVRPIVAGNFTKNQVLQWFDYEIHGDLKNAEDVDVNGFFIGNGHLPLIHELDLLEETLIQAFGF